MRLLSRTILSSIFLCAAVEGLAAQPFFAEIGSLDGGTLRSIAEGISADGVVASGDSGVVNGLYPTEGVIWTRAEGLRSIVPGRHSDCEGGGVNGIGTVITGGLIGNRTRYVYMWTPEGGVVELGDLDGGIFRSGATDVSARGDVIVGYGNSHDGGEAFRWTAETGMVGLGDLPGGPFSSGASAVSADGLVVVGGSRVEAGWEAFRWTAETGMVSLGDLPDGNVSGSATAVSADGSVVVGNGFDESGQRAFRWTAADGMVAIEKIHEDQSHQRAYDTSWDGNVIVGELGSSSAGTGPFYWTPEDGTRLLIDVFQDHGVEVPDGWRLSRASGVSADGRTIVGYGVSPHGNTQGWVAYLGPTCRADYDEDGVMTEADVTAYLLVWQRRNLFADWNYDGNINIIDLLGFFNEWAAGCE
ncbi:MAG: PEP-CTERM sorting domain-containing protein [Planctomycetota bacterium]|nr:MAG: PEP-CTERM sorting domain-containing protein [Planctomycetota bacterium]